MGIVRKFYIDFFIENFKKKLKKRPRKVATVIAKGIFDFEKEKSLVSVNDRHEIWERNFGYSRRDHFIMKIIKIYMIRYFSEIFRISLN